MIILKIQTVNNRRIVLGKSEGQGIEHYSLTMNGKPMLTFNELEKAETAFRKLILVYSDRRLA